MVIKRGELVEFVHRCMGNDTTTIQLLYNDYNNEPRWKSRAGTHIHRINSAVNVLIIMLYLIIFKRLTTQFIGWDKQPLP